MWAPGELYTFGTHAVSEWFTNVYDLYPESLRSYPSQVADVITMQSQYHVMGTSVGCFAKIPLQDIFSSLPVRLTPAEAAYLRDIGVARFLDESVLLEAPTNEEKEVHQRAKVKQYNDQVCLKAEHSMWSGID